jgi:hypothetical protein
MYMYREDQTVNVEHGCSVLCIQTELVYIDFCIQQ